MIQYNMHSRSFERIATFLSMSNSMIGPVHDRIIDCFLQRFNFEFAIRFHDPPSGHCDLANIAGLPHARHAAPEAFPAGSPPDATAEEGVCTTLQYKILKTQPLESFSAKKVKKGKNIPSKTGSSLRFVFLLEVSLYLQ
jgi:hypothetical protein